MRIVDGVVRALQQQYQTSLQKENELLFTANYHLNKWKESDCEDNEEYEKYQSAYNQYELKQRETNILARMIAENISGEIGKGE